VTPFGWVELALLVSRTQLPGLAPIPESERAALVALYRSAGGENWKNHDGWLGERGTECGWHGVTCVPANLSGSNPSATVIELDLMDNGLKGTLPPELDALSSLQNLRLYGSELSGSLPSGIREKWESGRLSVQGYAALAGVSEITLQYRTAAYCHDFEATLRADGAIVLLSERCKGEPRAKWQGSKGLGVSCERQTGWTDRFGDAFGRLAWFLEKQDFHGLNGQYSITITHGGFMTTSVVRRGERKTVEDYAEAGPMSLWLIEAAIQGVIRDAEWELNSRTPGTCRWIEFAGVY
jgi:hypothetical protein